ncbi:18524_t:CDS:1 [Acaulospora morrowiae]|uniref:18524_t:CDS:1 n=1 Tax=Acaulospora morrowiae TaxID=94023 RepID=A0A9N9JCH1_9GLOM|nr:18524_t:CDS:1 [Acaulospora morrowiae]
MAHAKMYHRWPHNTDGLHKGYTLIIVYFTSEAIGGSKDKEQQEQAVKERKH